ncbi:MAG: hypothetical protein AAF721_24880 [Myxococcota bacterium]
MKGYVGWVLLAACLVFTYQGWQTRSGVAESQARAKSVACDVGRECVLAHEQPGAIQADFMSRRYQFKTSVGPVTVTCARPYIFFGNFECKSVVGSMGTKS